MSHRGKTISGNHISIPEGDQTDIYCSTRPSQSDVDLQWVKPSGLRGASGQMQYVTIGGTGDAAAAGRYWCEGKNAVGTFKSALDVVIGKLSMS